MLRELIPIGSTEHVEVSAEDGEWVRLKYYEMIVDDEQAIDPMTVCMEPDEAIRVAQAINRIVEAAKRAFPQAAKGPQ